MSIKKLVVGSVVVSVLAAGIISCGGSKQGRRAEAAEKSQFGTMVDTPCQLFDDDDWVTATGIASGPRSFMGEIQKNAVSNGQRIILDKISLARPSTTGSYMLPGVRMICGPMFSAPDSTGKVTCYVGLKVSKKELADINVKDSIFIEELRLRSIEKMDEYFKTSKEE
jgi:hypothetical protein